MLRLAFVMVSMMMMSSTVAAGVDMSSTFAKLRTCTDCTAAGYGWCTIKRRCGGFANKECGIGEQYISASPAPRNGLWESSTKKKAKGEKAEARDAAEEAKAAMKRKQEQR